MATIIFMCWKCSKNILIEEPVGRSAECPVCHADIHCCKNCIYYSPGSHFDCHEDIDELVSDKEKSNFCDNFKLKRTFDGVKKEDNKAAEAKKAFDSLFSI